MKRIILIGCLLMGFNTLLFLQETAEELKVTLPDAVMEQVVKRIVTWYFKSPKKAKKTIYFAEENIKKEWLPAIANIEFVISKKGEKDYEQSVYLLRNLQKNGNGYEIWFGYGDRDCDAGGDIWSFHVRGSRVRLWKTHVGWGSACGSSDGGGSSSSP